MHNRRQRRRAGFTLMEILLVTAILVALASMATFAFVSIQKSNYSRTARMEISRFNDACQMYYTNNTTFPQSLQDLKVLPSGVDPTTWGGPYLDPNTDFTDPWRQEYRYMPNPANDTVIITSAGPDKMFDTADDISNAAR